MADDYGEVLVGTDGSQSASCAVAAATSLALALEVPLAVATAWYRHPRGGPSRREEAEEWPASPGGMEAGWASETVAAGAGIARRRGLGDVAVHTPEGNPADVLIDLAEDQTGTLVVVGTYGLSDRGERLLGNIPHQLTHHAPADVFLVTAVECPEPPSWDTVLLATDGSPTSAVACNRGLALARALGATATLVTVARSEERGEAALADATGHLDAEGLERRTITGQDVSGALSEAARDADLLVLGNKGMSGPSRLLGSVSNRVTHDVPTDILLVNTTR